MVGLEGFGTLISDELKIPSVTFLLQLIALFSRQPHKWYPVKESNLHVWFRRPVFLSVELTGHKWCSHPELNWDKTIKSRLFYH